ncbi:MAG: hypothetical protein H6818_04495 [Phycisphaerales bacterium]|nr:hypothetical protein [Phycisphaerales bacterium]MCB9864427.1 hypothetical protein [Phycisphaerales bacterium]
MRVRLLLCVVVTVATWAVQVHAEVRVCTYNLLQFTSSSLMSDPARVDAFKVVLSAIDPDILIVQEISNQAAVNLLRDQILNASGGPGGNPGTPEHYSAASFTDTASSLDQAILYRDAIFEEVAGSYTTLNTTPRITPRWRMRPVNAVSDSTDIYFYSMHLSSTDSLSRATQTQIVRADANALPAGTNLYYVGDFNIDSSSEASYQNLIGSQIDNDGRAFDPLNRPGTWSSNSSFADIHSQSPHLDNSGGPPGGVGGGMDDRFDFLLISAALQDSVGFDYIPGTYRSFGNDGHHYNMDINDNPVIPEGIAVANALHAASDHLPVMMHLTDPVTASLISLTPPSILSFPQALVGGVSSADLTVTNTAPVPAATLTYSFNPLAGFVIPVGTFMEPAGGGGNVHSLSLDSSTSGNKIGVLQINNDSANASPIKTILVSGSVLDHAIPSVTPSNQTTSGAIEFSTMGGGVIVDETARVYNADFNMTLSVPLSITSGGVSNDASGRFSLIGFAPVSGITDFADFTVRFDGVGAGPGTYTADLTFGTEDDSLLDGAMMLSDITFALSATVPGPLLGDFNLSGVVEPGDIPGMVALLLDPTGATMDDQAIGDMNQDSVNDSNDLQLFIDAMLP